MSVLVVAEPGATAQGCRETMFRLIDTAAECGANIYKATWLSHAEPLVERREAVKYRYAYQWHQWPVIWHADLRTRCHARGMQYAVTVDLPADIATIAPFVDYLKIAHFEADASDIQSALVRCSNRPRVLVSFAGGQHPERWSIHINELHTVSCYDPAPLSALNLSCLRRNDDGECRYQGYSDHSRHLLAGAVAVACGADIVETHFRLDDCDPSNVDYPVAFSPAEFTQYVKNIRDTEVMLGDGVKKLEACEQPLMKHRVTA